MFKDDVVFLGGEKIHPKQITDQQWRDLHHHFIDVSSGNRADLVSVRDEPVESKRFRKSLQEHGPFRSLGCSSTFTESAQTISGSPDQDQEQPASNDRRYGGGCACVNANGLKQYPPAFYIRNPWKMLVCLISTWPGPSPAHSTDIQQSWIGTGTLDAPRLLLQRSSDLTRFWYCSSLIAVRERRTGQEWYLWGTGLVGVDKKDCRERFELRCHIFGRENHLNT